MKKDFVIVQGRGFNGSGLLLDWFKEQYKTTTVPYRVLKFDKYHIDHNLGKLMSYHGTQKYSTIFNDFIGELELVYKNYKQFHFKKFWIKVLNYKLIQNFIRDNKESIYNPEIKNEKKPIEDLKFDIDFFKDAYLKKNKNNDLSKYLVRDWLSSKFQSENLAMSKIVIERSSISADLTSELNFFKSLNEFYLIV